MAEEAKTAEAPKAPSREELAQLAKAEAQERANRCFAKINAVLKEENCELIGRAELVEVPSGGWVISAKPGIVAR